MKRVKSELVQSTTLSYLKERNFTDSEASFRCNFKFEEDIAAMAARVVHKSCVGALDAVSLTATNLEDYFSSFERLRNFIFSQFAENKFSETHGLLHSIFVHSFLTLVLADRHSEAKQFYTHFVKDTQITLPSKILTQLQEMLDSNNLKKQFMIPALHSKFHEVTLTMAEHSLLLRFLQAEPDLVLAKLLKERIRIVISEAVTIGEQKGSPESLKVSPTPTQVENTSDSDSPALEPKSQIPVSSVVDTPFIISPPSLAVPASKPTPSATPQPFSEDNAVSFDVDLHTVQRRIEKVASSAAVAPQLCLYRFLDEHDSVVHATFSCSQKFICSGCDDSTVRLWNISEPVAKSDGTFADCKPSDATAASAAYTDVNATEKTRVVNVAQVNLGCDFGDDALDRALRTSSDQRCELHQEQFVTSLRGHSGPVYASCFTKDDLLLVTASEDTSIRLWSVDDLTNKAIYCGHNYPVLSLAMSALSMYFASGSYDCTARLWSVERTYPLRTYAGHKLAVQSVAFHDNANYLATADNTVRLWDVHSGETVRLMTGHWAPVMALSFSPNGRLLASAGEDCRIRVWDIASGNLMKEMRGHTHSVYSLSFNSDSSLLCSCGADNAVRVWNINESVSAGSHTESSHLIGHWKLGATNRAALAALFSANNLLKCICVDR